MANVYELQDVSKLVSRSQTLTPREGESLVKCYTSNCLRETMSKPAACIDICAVDDETKYLVLQGDQFIKIRSLKDKLPEKLLDSEGSYSWPKLSECCRDGDHYVAHTRGKSLTNSGTISGPDKFSSRQRRHKFCIIFRDRDYNIIKVRHSLGIDIEPEQRHLRMDMLNGNYRGGDFYFAKGSEFYVIFKKSNTFLRTSTLSKEPAVEKRHQKLHKELRNGLYYFGTTEFIYVVIAINNTDLVYRRIRDLQSIEGSAIPIHESVAEVLRNRVQLPFRPWKNHTAGTPTIMHLRSMSCPTYPKLVSRARPSLCVWKVWFARL
jgi:hypothetical protein